MRIIISGDLHGDFESLNHLIASERPDYILQCGDFGYYPGNHGGWPPKNPQIIPGECLVHFADGNHEDHDALSLALQNNRLEGPRGVFFQPRGSVLSLPDGRNVLFIGGAEASQPREPVFGVVINDAPVPPLSLDVLNDLPGDIKIDIVISHTCPSSFDLEARVPHGYEPRAWKAKLHDPTRETLDKVLHRCKPERWFFGHFHIHQEGMIAGCKWCALGFSEGEEKWWDVL